MSDNLVYILDEKIYINLTNLCTNDCVFCIRTLKDDVVGANLFLQDEKIDVREVFAQLKKFDIKENEEIVFCGYGEPLIKFEEIKQISKYIKENYKNIRIRVNTNGQGNMIHKRDIVPELAQYIDAVSISLNAETEQLYDELSRPKAQYKGAYSRVKEFIWYCAKAGIDTTATIVVGYKDYNVDVEKCRQIAQNLGAKFRIREWLDNGY